jgi:hypothetical protein
MRKEISRIHTNEGPQFSSSCMGVNSDGNLDRNKRDEHHNPEKCHEEAWRIEVKLWDFFSATNNEWDQSHNHCNAIHPRGSIQFPLGP